MARQRKLSPERKAFINSLLEHYHPSDAQDVQEMLKDLLSIPVPFGSSAIIRNLDCILSEEIVK